MLQVPAGKSLQLVDARPQSVWSDTEISEAIERHYKRSGPLVALVKARLDAALEADLAELNRLAGGQASHRVAALARNAMLAQEALELQRLHAEVQAGEETKGIDNALRNLSGLSVFATQALEKAYEAAREEGKRANPVADLRRTIGLGLDDLGADDPDVTGRVTKDPVDAGGGVPGGSGMTQRLVASPLSPPGEGRSGPPSPEIAPPPKGSI